MRETGFSVPPPPVQQPRIPIWVVGAWPRRKSMRRALRYDGIIPTSVVEDEPGRQSSVEEVRELAAHVRGQVGDTPYEIIVEGTTPAGNAAAARSIVRPWADAGATWWIEAMWQLPQEEASINTLRERLRAGPPSL